MKGIFKSIFDIKTRRVNGLFVTELNYNIAVHARRFIHLVDT